MARFAFVSAVYLGDVAPFIPPARLLAQAGHEVTFVAPEGFRSVLEPEPFRFHPYGLDSSPAALHADAEHNRLMRHPFRNTTRLGSLWIHRTFADDPDAALASLESGFAGADVVVSHPTMASVAVPVARAAGAKVAIGQLFPMMIPTDHWTPPLGPWSLRLPRPVNRAAWGLVRRLTGRAFGDDGLNDARRRYGLAPLVGNAGWAWLEADATVVLVSRHYYGDGAPDWPPVRWGGFSIWDGPPGQQLDAELEAYLDAGDPPVLLTLGTSAATGAGDTFAAVAAGLAARGLRSILLVGDAANLGAVSGHPAARAFAPITRLLPRCRAALVSGALGGVAAALTAGVPVVVHPQLFDQVWHGRQVERLGVGRLARRVRAVVPALADVATDAGVAARARALGASLAAEDGAAVMADTVAGLVPAG